MEHTAYIALGANLGDREACFERALVLIDALPECSVEARSSWHRTDPVDCPPGSEPFLNGAAKLLTSFDPHSLMYLLLMVEREFGRDRSRDDVNAPRTLDLDLLLFDQAILESEDLILPHPRMLERRFVLAPLAEIAADLEHPVSKQSIADALSELG